MDNAAILPLLVVSLSTFLQWYSYILFVRLLLTWFPNIEWMQQIVGFVSPITDPYLNLFRFIPPIGGTFDVSPILAIFALQVVMNTVGQIPALLPGL